MCASAFGVWKVRRPWAFRYKSDATGNPLISRAATGLRGKSVAVGARSAQALRGEGASKA
jgi:hypothetical protein